MRYHNEPDFRHDAPSVVGVLIVNLGTPNSPQIVDVRRYLREFLSDPRLVELPRPLWWLILHGIILRFRPKHSAAAYKRIWNTDGIGSPLLTISHRQTTALQTALVTGNNNNIKVVLAMRYGSPSIATGLVALRNAGARRILVLPLYPQYSATTTGSVFDAVTQELRRWRWVPELRFIHQYHDAPAYITALANKVRDYWAKYGEPDRLLLSFHGIPKDYFVNGDPYYYHCQKTARLVAMQLGLDQKRWQVAFQSRVGPKEWLKPYTDQQLADWARAGVNKVHVMCPGFAADCLETLDEIMVENKALFLEAGGKEYGYIPALNADPEHIAALAILVQQHVHGWHSAIDATDPQAPAQQPETVVTCRQ